LPFQKIVAVNEQAIERYESVCQVSATPELSVQLTTHDRFREASVFQVGILNSRQISNALIESRLATGNQLWHGEPMAE
jgi:hypothetical protein